MVNPQPKSERRRSDDGYEYGADFYRFMASFAVRSARRIVPKLIAALPVRSVVDFGCGHGAWLSVWAEAGASVFGVDGAYVDRRLLLIDPACFQAADLSEPIDLGRKFDLVQSLEVAEHIPAANVGNIRRYASLRTALMYCSRPRPRGKAASTMSTSNRSNIGGKSSESGVIPRSITSVR